MYLANVERLMTGTHRNTESSWTNVVVRESRVSCWELSEAVPLSSLLLLLNGLLLLLLFLWALAVLAELSILFLDVGTDITTASVCGKYKTSLRLFTSKGVALSILIKIRKEFLADGFQDLKTVTIEVCDNNRNNNMNNKLDAKV